MTTTEPVDVIIPMAGDGARFRDAGYAVPKPFIDMQGAPMIARVMDNLALPNARYILIAQQAHVDAQPAVVDALRRRYPCEFVTLQRRTEGSAATILFARHVFHRDGPIVIANADQLVDGGIAPMVDDARARQLDGSIMTFAEPGRHPKWSYARTDDRGLVQEVREKVAISAQATVGIYHFATGEAFVDAATEMIINNDRTNGEFYTCPVYNYVIAQRRAVGVWDIPPAAMHGLGTPSDLEQYLAQRAAPSP